MALAPPDPDRLGRPLADLRISVTDRCNFRCTYCMPREVYGPDHPFLPRGEILDFEEIARLARPVRRARRTQDPPDRRRAAGAPRPAAAGRARSPALGVDLALTTNGSLLAAAAAGAAPRRSRPTHRLARRPRRRGLPAHERRRRPGRDRARRARRRARGRLPSAQAQRRRPTRRQRAARSCRSCAASSPPDTRSASSSSWTSAPPTAGGSTRSSRRARSSPGCRASCGSSRSSPPTAARSRGATGAPELGGEIGIVSSVSQPFCGDCTRARLSADGRLFTCLFAAIGTDLRGPLRAGASDQELAALVARVWRARDDRYSERRSAATGGGPRVEMSYIGG